MSRKDEILTTMVNHLVSKGKIKKEKVTKGHVSKLKVKKVKGRAE